MCQLIMATLRSTFHTSLIRSISFLSANGVWPAVFYPKKLSVFHALSPTIVSLVLRGLT